MAGPSYEKVEEGEPLEEGAPVEEGVELAARPCVFEVRVLDVKNQGAAHVVRVPEGGRVDDLMGAIEGALAHAPAARQRLIVNGKQLKAGEALAAFGVERGARAAPTVHLMVRPPDAPVAVRPPRLSMPARRSSSCASHCRQARRHPYHFSFSSG